MKISKKSIDARENHGGFYILSIDFEIDNEDRFLKNKNISKVEPFIYNINKKTFKFSPIIVGFGPSGMLAALILAKAGANPIIIERGKSVELRSKDINNFWKNKVLNIESNVQFGEGGAGTFSDGKLTTGIKDVRCRVVLEEFVKFGAPEEILYLAKPHIGTDNLIKMVKNIRNEILKLGGKILFEHKFVDFNCKNNNIVSIKVKNNDSIFEIETNHVILAIGHSARDTFELMYEKNHPIIQKPFAVGVRIEHKQDFINKKQ